MYFVVVIAGQGEFGHAPMPVWPGDHNFAYSHARCPRGLHILDIGGHGGGYDHYHQAATLTCSVCDLGEPGRGRWALIDPEDQATPATAKGQGTELVALPPPVRAGVGRIEVRHTGHVLASIDLMLCPVDERGVIEQVRTDPEHRASGYGRLLVAAARARGRGYRWSTTKIDETFAARAFWSRVAWSSDIGEPHYCSHMLAAADVTP